MRTCSRRLAKARDLHAQGEQLHDFLCSTEPRFAVAQSETPTSILVLAEPYAQRPDIISHHSQFERSGGTAHLDFGQPVGQNDTFLYKCSLTKLQTGPKLLA